MLIEVSTISGTGSIDVSGGSTFPCCTSQRTGAGGGGRVALYAGHFDGFDPVTQVTARGGVRLDTNKVANGFAAPGTIFVFTTSIYGDLLIDSVVAHGWPVPAASWGRRALPGVTSLTASSCATVPVC